MACATFAIDCRQRYFPRPWRARRSRSGDWIRTARKFDAVADFDAATRDPQQPTRLEPDFDSGDHIHPNDAGNAAMANAIDTTIFAR